MTPNQSLAAVTNTISKTALTQEKPSIRILKMMTKLASGLERKDT